MWRKFLWKKVLKKLQNFPCGKPGIFHSCCCGKKVLASLRKITVFHIFFYYYYYYYLI